MWAVLFSQAVVAPAQQVQAGNPAAIDDPTKPEIQPPLDIDRDPIASPDLNVPPPTAAIPPARTRRAECSERNDEFTFESGRR